MRKRTQVSRRKGVEKLRNNNFCSPYVPLCYANNNQRKDTHDEKYTKVRLRDVVAALISVIRGKKETNGEFTVGTFSFLLFLLFKFIGGLGMFSTAIIGIADIIAIVQYAKDGIEDVRMMIYYVIVLMLMWLFFVYSVMVWGAAKEIEKEKDKNYVLAVFSGVVSLASLIVAIVQFLREGN